MGFTRDTAAEAQPPLPGPLSAPKCPAMDWRHMFPDSSLELPALRADNTSLPSVPPAPGGAYPPSTQPGFDGPWGVNATSYLFLVAVVLLPKSPKEPSCCNGQEGPESLLAWMEPTGPLHRRQPDLRNLPWQRQLPYHEFSSTPGAMILDTDVLVLKHPYQS